MESLLEKIDRTLGDERYASDVPRAGRVWLDLAERLRSELDQAQLQALDVASRYWSGEGADEARLSWLEKLCDRMDQYLRKGEDQSRAATINRIVAASLMTTMGLSHETGEFVVELSERLRIDEETLAEIFARHVPEFG